MQPPHWPRRRTGLGDASINEFTSLITKGGVGYDPQFASAWGDIEAQLTQEAGITGNVDAATGGALSGTLTGAKIAFAGAFDQIAQSPGMSDAVNAAGNIYDTAKQFVMTGKTVAGAISTVSGIIDHANGTNQLATFQAFTGTMIGALETVGALTGVATLGIGAVITAFVGVGVELLQGAIGKPEAPPPNGYTPCCNFVLYEKPDWTVGGLGVWGSGSPGSNPTPGIVPTPGVFAPNTPYWRVFPDPNDPADAAWFAHQGGPGYWKGAFYGFWTGIGPGYLYNYDSMWSAWGDDRPDKGGLFASTRLVKPTGGDPPFDRAIDNAFPGGCNYSTAGGSVYSVVVEAAAGFTLISGLPLESRHALAVAFSGAWKANAAYALNGLKPQPDWMVLAHLLRMWNRSHAGPMVVIPPVGDPIFSGQNTPGYLGQLVTQAIGQGVPDLLYQNGLGVNSGAQHAVGPLGAGGVVQLSLPSSAPTGMSTGAKIVVGTALVGGAAVLGTAGYATWKGVSVKALVKGWLGR